MSWKKYGGIDKYEKMNHIKANSIVTDTIIVKESFLSDFVVDGTMTVSDATLLRGSLNVEGLTIMKNSLDVSGDLIISGRLFLTDTTTFIKGSSGKIGFNVETPTSTFDIASINERNTLNVYTNTIQNRNILARNNIDNGLAFFVDGTNSSSIQFYNKTASYDANGTILQNGVTSDTTGLSSHAKIEYSNINNRQLLKVSGTALNETELLTKLTVSNRDISHNFTETVAIYDSESIDLYPNIAIFSNAKYGNALTLYGDESKNDITFLNIRTQKKGLYIGGGKYPVEPTKSMCIIDLTNEHSDTLPAQIIIDGSNNYAKTIGLNTYEPNPNHVLNVNGPLYVSNDNIETIYTASYEIINYIVNPSYPNKAIACGLKYYALYTNDGGKNWNIGNTITQLQSAELTIYDGKNFDESKSIITSYSGGFVFFSINGGIDYNAFTTIPNGIYCGMHIYNNYVYYANRQNFYYFAFNWSSPITNPTINNVTIDNYSNVYKVEGFDNILYVLKSTSIEKHIIFEPAYNEFNSISSYLIINSDPNTLQLKVFNTNVVIVKSDNLIYSTTNGGNSWNVKNLSLLFPSITASNIKHIYIYDETRASIIGNSFILYSFDGFVNWNIVTKNMLNSSGLSYLLHNKNLTSLYMPNANDFYLSIFENNQTIITKLFSPSILNFQYEPVIETIGSIKSKGDVMINDGQLRSNNSTFDILPDSHNTINIGADTDVINIGTSTGVVNIPNNAVITNTFTTNFEAGNSTITDLVVLENLSVESGQITSSSSDFNLLPASHNIINLGTSSSTMNIGNDTIHIGSGFSDIFLDGRIKGSLVVDGSFIVQTNIQQNGDLELGGDLYSNRVFATSTSVETLDVSGTSTLKNVIIEENLLVNSGQFDSSNNIFNLLPTPHDAINVGSNTDFINIGKPGGSVTLSGNTNIVNAFTTNLESSGNSVLNDVSATNLTIFNISNMNTLNAQDISTITITTNDLSANNINIQSTSTFEDDVTVNAKIIASDGSFNTSYINQLTSNNITTGTADISSIIVDTLTVNDDANVKNLDVSNNAILNNLIVENDSSFNDNVYIAGNTSIVGNVNINNNSSLVTSSIKGANTNVFNLLSTGSVSHNTLNIGLDVSFIKLGGEFTSIEFPSGGSVTTSTATSTLTVANNIYFGYNETDVKPQLGNQYAIFNGDVVVFNSTTLNDVSASYIDTTTLDSTTTYLSDKLYFGYRSDDSNIPSIPSNTAYFNGDVEITGNTVLQDASLSTIEITNNLTSYSATFNDNVEVYGTLTSNGSIIQW